MSETATWQPSASIPNLLKRAAVMAEIRRFFIATRCGRRKNRAETPARDSPAGRCRQQR